MSATQTCGCMFKPQLAPLNVEEPLKGQDFHLVCQGEPRQPSEEAHFHLLRPKECVSFVESRLRAPGHR